MLHYSLLDDPFITVQTTGGVIGATLPDILDLLDQDAVLGFEALQPHQQQPWYTFLVQLKALAEVRAGNAPSREQLLALSRGSESAWALVADDAARPAFMQPPIPGGSPERAGYKPDLISPDGLDVLVTAKNHDLKMQRIRRPRPEHWLYALLTLQTMEGFLGAGNYGIVRMNGGFGNRPFLGVSGGLSWGSRFQRDVRVLAEARPRLADRYDLHGAALLWLEPWPGDPQSARPLHTCDPWFIEICRRIRLALKDEHVFGWRATSGAARIQAPEALYGQTGDPWTPIDKARAKALTLGEGGFDYRMLDRLLFSGDFERPPAMAFRPEERSGAFLTARALVRGQGKTEGLHHRTVPIGSGVVSLFSNDTEREKLARRSRERVVQASEVQKNLLFPALAALLTSGREKKADGARLSSWTDAFNRAIDAVFFDRLWQAVELSQEQAARQWQQTLWDTALRVFEQAEAGLPVASIHYWRARTKARGILFGKRASMLPLLTTQPPETDV